MRTTTELSDLVLEDMQRNGSLFNEASKDLPKSHLGSPLEQFSAYLQQVTGKQQARFSSLNDAISAVRQYEVEVSDPGRYNHIRHALAFFVNVTIAAPFTELRHDPREVLSNSFNAARALGKDSAASKFFEDFSGLVGRDENKSFKALDWILKEAPKEYSEDAGKFSEFIEKLADYTNNCINAGAAVSAAEFYALPHVAGILRKKLQEKKNQFDYGVPTSEVVESLANEKGVYGVNGNKALLGNMRYSGTIVGFNWTNIDSELPRLTFYIVGEEKAAYKKSLTVQRVLPRGFWSKMQSVGERLKTDEVVRTQYPQPLKETLATLKNYVQPNLR